MMKFRGHAHRSLDDKGRLILPPEFRDAIRAELPDAVIVLTIFDKHVIGITPDQWSKLERELESIKSPSRALQNTIRLLNLGYTETPVGKQGRIAIPAHLRKSGKLDKEVVVIDQDYDVSTELAENNVSLPF
jgi:MraZ protein